jgi:universal stress protein A
MIALQRILLPTDFSTAVEPAVKMVQLLAERFDAAVHVLHVREERADFLPDFGMGIDLQPYLEAWKIRYEEREPEILRRLSEVLDTDWKHGRQTTIATRSGRPFLEIVDYAREHQIDLIVMGTHGRGGLTHAMLGSVAENVVRSAPCPVMTVRPHDQNFEMP